MKKHFFALFSAALCAVVSCSAPKNSLPAQDVSKVFTIVSYNVGAFAKAGYDTMPLCVEALKGLAPDAVVLNELDSCNTRGGTNVFQMDRAASAMGGWSYVYGSAIPYKKGSYGIGAMVAPSYSVIDRWTAKLPKADGREVRALAVIETENFIICGTHLDLTAASQLAQADAINSLIAAKYSQCSKPVFLCGDMNAEPGSETLSRLLQSWNLLSSTDCSYSSSNPRKCIDYIFSFKRSGKVEVTEAKVVKIKEASDHFPQMVKVKF